MEKEQNENKATLASDLLSKQGTIIGAGIISAATLLVNYWIIPEDQQYILSLEFWCQCLSYLKAFTETARYSNKRCMQQVSYSI